MLNSLLSFCVFLLCSFVASGCPDCEGHRIDTVLLKSQIIGNDIEMMRNMAFDQAISLAGNARMIAAVKEADFKEADREKIANILNNFESARKSAFFTILDSEGQVIFRSSRPEQWGDSQAHLRSVGEVLTTKKPCVFFDSTVVSRLTIRAGAPIFDEAGEMIGIVTNGFRLDTNDWVDEMQRRLGNDLAITVFHGNERVASTVRINANERADERAIGTVLDNPLVVKTVLDDMVQFIGDAIVRGTAMKVLYAPIYNEGDSKAIGMFFIGMPQQRRR